MTDRAMHSVQLIGKMNIQEPTRLFGLEEIRVRLAKANEERWYGQVPKMDGDHVLRRALGFKIVGGRKRRRPEMLKRQAKETKKD